MHRVCVRGITLPFKLSELEQSLFVFSLSITCQEAIFLSLLNHISLHVKPQVYNTCGQNVSGLLKRITVNRFIV